MKNWVLTGCSDFRDKDGDGDGELRLVLRSLQITFGQGMI